MKKNKILTYLICLLSVTVTAQSIRLSGTATGSEGKLLHVYEYSDLLTNLQTEIAAIRIDSSGNFSSEAVITAPGAIILSIDFHAAEIFVEPGKDYSISIAPVNNNAVAELNPFIESQPLEITVNNEDPASLNALISRFNLAYNEFVLANFNDIYKNRNIKVLDDFREKMKETFTDTANPYFAAYMKYKFAALEKASGTSGNSQLISEYFGKVPVLYRNVEYMDFFSLFFQRYILAISRPLKFIDYPSILGKTESYDNMMKALLADTNLKRKEFRELVLLHGLTEMYFEPGYTKESVLTLLNEISEKSSIPEHRLIAKNIVLVVTKLQKGTPAPEFTLRDRNGDSVSLADFRGKPVMLSFWATWCQECVNELEKIKPLSDKYAGQVEFISISADKSFSKMNMYLNMKKDFIWRFLHIGESIDLLREYQVKSYPLFVLIGKDGMIYEYPAPSPGEGLEAAIARMLNP